VGKHGSYFDTTARVALASDARFGDDTALMNDSELEGWKRCLLRSDGAGELLVAGAFAKRFGPLDTTLACVCGRSECWCGFSAHRTLPGAMRYRPLTYPIAHVVIAGDLRFGGGRKKEYLIGYRQTVLQILWPQLCAGDGCLSPAEGLTQKSEGTLLPACQEHGATHSLELESERSGTKMLWLSTDYTRWTLAQR